MSQIEFPTPFPEWFKERVSYCQDKRFAVFYDTIALSELTQTTRLFGNVNVGNMALTNLQVAGHLATDVQFAGLYWWLDGVDIPVEALREITVTPTCGDMPEGNFPADIAWRNPVPYLKTIPVRQHFSVELFPTAWLMQNLHRFAEPGSRRPYFQFRMAGWQVRGH